MVFGALGIVNSSISIRHSLWIQKLSDKVLVRLTHANRLNHSRAQTLPKKVLGSIGIIIGTVIRIVGSNKPFPNMGVP